MNKIFPITLLSIAISACGGGSGTSTGSTPADSISGLKLPNSMSVVTASSTTASRTAAKNYTDVDSDYTTAEANAYVYDASMESLQTVNMILCLMDQTRASDMVNQGAYLALVNEDKCEQGQNQSSSGSTGQSSGGQVVEFNSWTIESTRASNDAAQIVKMWVPGETGGNSDPRDRQTILVEVTATEAVSGSKPFGSFTLNFNGIVDAGDFGGTAGQELAIMKGSLATVANSDNKPQFQYVSVSGNALPDISDMDFSQDEAANVILDDADGSSGIALASRSESFDDGVNSFSGASTFAIAFNSTHLLRGKDNNGDDLVDAESCKSRSSFDTQVWRYNLYHKVDGTFNGQSVLGGDRVEMNSGFPFTFDSDDSGSDDKQGWVGYHGIWAEGNAVPDGTTINQFDYDTDTSIARTVNVSPGKMIRRSAQVGTLSELQGEELQFWGEHPTLNVFGQWLVTVDANNDFNITGSMAWSQGNAPQVSPTVDDDNNPATAEVAVAATISLTNNENIWLWSDALGGNVTYVQDDAVAAVDRTVTFYLEEFITPADSTLFPQGTSSISLYCYDRCLKGGLTQGDINTDPTTPGPGIYYTYAGTPFQYTLTVNNGKVILTDDSNSNAVVSAVGLDASSLGNDWGINTGEMLAIPLGDPNQPWAVYGEPVTYRWETGDNDWNRLVTVTDTDGVVATFDKPLQLAYTHSTANDANDDSTKDGKKFLLEYRGNGELSGFPWVEDTETNRWHSSVTLKDATTLSDGTNDFVIKAIEKEQTMKDDADCGLLEVNSLFTNTSLTLPTASNTATVSFTLADKPNVTAAPAVIEGELK
jgi:hypothetical protein